MKKEFQLNHQADSATGAAFHRLPYGQVKKIALVFSAVITLMTSACHKLSDDHDDHSKNVINKYSGLSTSTRSELMSAQQATERYRNIGNAIADGYADINVVVEHMGFHYMKSGLVDTVFQAIKPEILVYNKSHDGKIELVAVEYAVPIDLQPDRAPEGFTGTQDVWKRDTGFGLWLLHAWVWAYNPDGVFNPTNPAVHLH